jgi:phage terminase large subunit
MQNERSTPSFSEFDPTRIPTQYDLVRDIEERFDYSLGVHECLLSGSLGSGKSLPAAHLAIAHCLKYPKARLLLGRKAMPDLRDTIFTKIIEHLDGTEMADGRRLQKGVHYDYSEHYCSVWFANGSEMIARSWADKRYKKLGSLELSAAVIEELTENDEDDEIAVRYVRTRVGRLPHIPVNWIIYCTNPDSPAHFAYRYFELGKRQLGLVSGLSPTRHVYFSSTADNPFLPDWYIDQLSEDLDPKLAERLIHGKWIELFHETIYYQFSEKNTVDRAYQINDLLPIYISFDFNIGEGKPMSACLSQFDPESRVFHFYAESVVEGASTEQQMEEIAGRGLLDEPCQYIIHGDATGGARATQSRLSDYDIIKKFLSNYRTRLGSRIDFEMRVPKSNPPVRERHNRVNAYLKNMNEKTRILCYSGTKTLVEGFRLASLKKGGSYVEDDSKPYQHVTAAAGYSICSVHRAIHGSRPYYERRVR